MFFYLPVTIIDEHTLISSWCFAATHTHTHAHGSGHAEQGDMLGSCGQENVFNLSLILKDDNDDFFPCQPKKLK